MEKIEYEKLVVGISSTALFDLDEAERVFSEEGIKKYREFMLAWEEEPFAPGTGMPLVKALLGLRHADPDIQTPLVEVVVMSKNSLETGMGIINSVRKLDLPITRFALTGGESLAVYVDGYQIDLFLSRDEGDVQSVIDSGKCAAALLYDPPPEFKPVEHQLRIAFDADAVIFSDASEVVYKNEGLPGFHAREDREALVPLDPGPHANFLRKLAALKKATHEVQEYSPVRIAVVTARNAPAEKRVLLTLRQWGVYVDAGYFLGGWDKTPVLRAFRPHIFFDDQDRHVEPAARVVPSGKVPYLSTSPLATPKPVPGQTPVEDVPLRRSDADLRAPDKDPAKTDLAEKGAAEDTSAS